MHAPSFLLEDEEEVTRLIRENPEATIVSNTTTGLVASHYPVVLEESEPGISVVSHVGRPDERLHDLGRLCRLGTTSSHTCTERRRSSATTRTTGCSVTWSPISRTGCRTRPGWNASRNTRSASAREMRRVHPVDPS